MADSTYLIIGGGIVGSSIAYHLSGRDPDAEVVILERNDDIADETTARSGATFGWYGDAMQRDMKRYGWELYNNFLGNPHVDPEPFHEYTGMLKVATSENKATYLKRITDPNYDRPVPKTMQGGEKDTVEYLDGSEIKRTLFVPELNDEEVTGAVFRPNYGFVDPVPLTHEFAARARERGARFELGTAVTGIPLEDGRVTGVETGDGFVEGDHVVCAGGPWNVELGEEVGLDLPIRHTLGPMIRLRPSWSPRTGPPLLIHEDSGAFCRRDPDGTYLIGHRPRGEDALNRYEPEKAIDRMPDGLRELARDAIEPLLPHLEGAEHVGETVAVRSDVADNRPVLGWTSVSGFSIAGFDSSGIQLAPAAGDIIARQLVDDDPTQFYDDVSVARFDGYDDVQ